jgi:salicylate hydroxylase
VYEQAAELGEVGAGVGLFPNSVRILQRLGVADSVARRAAPINEWWMLAPGGSVVSHQVAGRDGPISSLGTTVRIWRQSWRPGGPAVH